MGEKLSFVTFFFKTRCSKRRETTLNACFCGGCPIVVYLDPSEFKSTWSGNKSISSTHMAVANNGELIVLAPGLKEFGEDKEIDRLIRKYGYITTPEILGLVKNNSELRKNLSAAAHLIHG